MNPSRARGSSPLELAASPISAPGSRLDGPRIDSAVPPSSGAPGSLAPPSSGSESLDRAPVLVLHPDEEPRRTLVALLREEGLHAEGAASEDEASALLDQRAPAVLVVDVSAGSEIVGRLRAKPAMHGVPVIGLTPLEDDTEIARAFSLGVDDFVRRTPFRPALFLARVRTQLRLRRAAEELLRRSHDAELLVELTQALASSLDPRQILYTVVVRIAEVVRIDRVSIVLVRENDDRGFVVVTSDDPELRDRAIDIGAYPEIRQALTERQPLVIHDVASHPILDAIRQTSSVGQFASLAIVPLLFEDRPMGVLFLRSRARAAFDDRALSLCKTLANATAVGLRNARVLQSLRDQTQQITFARYEAERRLRSMQRFADFFESIDDGVCVMDPEGCLLFANRRAKELTGYEENELKGRPLRALLSAESVDRGKEIRTQLERRIFPRNVDLRVVRKDGVVRTFCVNYSSVLHEQDAVLLTLRDVTAEREAAVELQQTKDFLEHLIESSVDAIVSADMRGRIVLFNRAAERIHGTPATEILGTKVERLYPKGVAKQIMSLIHSDSFGGKGRLQNFRTEFVTASGELVPISLNAALITREERAIGTVGIFTDLRDRLRIEQRLAHAQEQLRVQEKQTIVAELAGAAAHELNQPLTSVMGYAELLRRRLDAGTPQHHAADIIVSEAERMAEIVRKIGKITRYETKSYVGTARILDLDRASSASSAPDSGGSAPPSSPSSSPSSSSSPIPPPRSSR